MGHIRLITGSPKYQSKRKVNWKAEKQMRKFQRALDKDKREYDKKDHWKRIPNDLSV